MHSPKESVVLSMTWRCFCDFPASTEKGHPNPSVFRLIRRLTTQSFEARAEMRANQFPVSTFAPNPQLQRFCLLLDFVSVDPIPRPPQYFGPVRLSHPAECNQNSPKSKCPLNQELLQIPAQSRITRPGSVRALTDATTLPFCNHWNLK